MAQLNPYQAPEASLELDYDDSGQLATPWQRVKAALVDGLLGGLAPGIIAAIGIPMMANHGGVSAAFMAVAGLWVLGFLILTVRSVIANGQTLGKKYIGIKVVRTDGSRCGMARMFFLRNVALGVVINLLNLVTFGVANIISLIDVACVFRASRQCLHDQIADTKVIVA